MKKALVTLAIIGLAASVHAQNFNAPTYSDGPLVGQDSWTQIGTVVTNPIQVANTATNGVATITTSGQDAFRTFTGTAATPALDSSVELFADINLSAAQTGDYFLALTDGGSSNFNDRLFAKAGTDAGTFQLALATGSGTPAAAAYGAELNFGTTYNIGALYNFVAGATNDTAQLFVNGNAYMTGVTQGTDATSITSILIRQGSSSSSATGSIDNLSVTVIPAVPEPATWMLLGVGLLAGAQRLRRKA